MRIDDYPIQAHAGYKSRRHLPLYLATAALLAVSLAALMSRPPVVVHGTVTATDPGPRPLPAAAGNFFLAVAAHQSFIPTPLPELFTEVNFVAAGPLGT